MQKRFIPTIAAVALSIVATSIAVTSGTLAAQQTSAAAQQPPPPVPSIRVTTGGQPVDAEIFVWSGGPKPVEQTGADGELTFDPKLLAAKGVSVVADAVMDVFRVACQDGKIRLLLAPDNTRKDQLGCANRDRPIVPGQDCDCDEFAAIAWGPNMTVNMPAATRGMSTKKKTLIFAPIFGGAAAALGAGLSGEGNDGNATAQPTLASASGNYAGLQFNQTSQSCNPPRFGNAFTATATVILEETGAVRITVVESATFTLTGTLQRNGNAVTGSVSGSGTSAAGTPLSITATPTFNLGSPTTLTLANYQITNTQVQCGAMFNSNSVNKQ